MRQLARDLWQLDGRPPNLVNVYLAGDALLDAGTRLDAGRILRQCSGHKLAAHALTHAHPDHTGSSHAVCEQLGIPFWVGRDDAAAAEDPTKMAAAFAPGALGRLGLPIDQWMSTLASAVAPGHPVARRLQEGDEVAGFAVLEVPGHTAGHIALWRESDRVLIAGDVLWNFQFAMGKPGLTQPAPTSNMDSALNRQSARRLATLEPQLVCFGHGPPMRETRKFLEFIESLPEP